MKREYQIEDALLVMKSPSPTTNKTTVPSTVSTSIYSAATLGAITYIQMSVI